jgi:prepilin-type N-terminal cleavage/methylation domain-containing protein
MHSNHRFARSGGWSLIELMVVVAIFGVMVAVATPYFLKVGRHSRLLSQVHEIQTTLLAARMQAIKRNQQVVVQFFVSNPTNCPGGGSCVITFVDNGPGALSRNFVQDAGEPTIGTYTISQEQRVFFLNPVNPSVPTRGIAFDTYNGNGALVDLVAFQGDGTVVNPQAAYSARPTRPGSYTAKVPSGSINCPAGDCRGIYITNDPDTTVTTERDAFRISVDDFGSSGKISVLKWLPQAHGGNAGEVNFVPGSPWIWLN